MYNYCDKGYDNTNKKIDDFFKKHPYCYIQGPTGPKGETGAKGDRGDIGPATIKVGTTETVSELENASVSGRCQLFLSGYVSKYSQTKPQNV
ncbi:MAG: hypothetical protein BHW07_00435 [Clostridium sp. CAG_433_25_7]|nr:MAG: hypothetical protein BHW07_00435 [Clostridium sp. CAG_433_25_7]